MALRINGERLVRVGEVVLAELSTAGQFAPQRVDEHAAIPRMVAEPAISRCESVRLGGVAAGAFEEVVVWVQLEGDGVGASEGSCELPRRSGHRRP